MLIIVYYYVQKTKLKPNTQVGSVKVL